MRKKIFRLKISGSVGVLSPSELGLLANYGNDSLGNVITRLLTHVIFHPVQKSLNRQIQIDYTVRIQSLTNLVTI